MMLKISSILSSSNHQNLLTSRVDSIQRRDFLKTAAALTFLGVDLCVPSKGHAQSPKPRAFKADGAISTLPLVVEGAIYCASSGHDGAITLYAIDGKSGELSWKRSCEGDKFYQPTLHMANKILMIAVKDSITGVHPGTGSPLWRFKAEDGCLTCSPVCSNKNIYFGTSEACFYEIDSATGEVTWKVKIGGNACRPVVHDGKVYAK